MQTLLYQVIIILIENVFTTNQGWGCPSPRELKEDSLVLLSKDS